MRTVLLNVFLTFALVVSLAALFLNHAQSHLSAAVTVVVIAAVTAIVTSVCLSTLGRKFLEGEYRSRNHVPQRINK